MGRTTIFRILAPEKIAYKVVMPKIRHSVDTFEGWCIRNVARREYKSQKKLMPPPPPKQPMAHVPNYRMTANLRMALEAIDEGVSYSTAAEAFGISKERLRQIKILERFNPSYVGYRK